VCRWHRGAPRLLLFIVTWREAEGKLCFAEGFLGKFPGRKGRKCHPETGTGLGAALLRRGRFSIVEKRKSIMKSRPLSAVRAKLCRQSNSTGITTSKWSWNSPIHFVCMIRPGGRARLLTSGGLVAQWFNSILRTRLTDCGVDIRYLSVSLFGDERKNHTISE